MADKKVSELGAITGANTAADDLFLIVDSSGSVTKKITREELNNAIERDVLSTVNIDGGTIDGTTIGGTTAAAGTFTDLTATGTLTGILGNVVEDTTPQLGGNLDTNGNNINFADNAKAQFGAGSDLQIYHDGSHSRIDDAGTGDLILRANDQFRVRQYSNNEEMIVATTDAEVKLYYDGSKKFETTSTGIDVTGVITTDAITETSGGNVGVGTSSPDNVNGLTKGGTHLMVNNDSGGARLNVEGSTDARLHMVDTGASANQKTYLTKVDGGNYTISLENDAGSASERLRIDSSGQVMIGTTTAGGQFTVTESDATAIIDRIGTNVAGLYTGSGDDLTLGTNAYKQAIRIKNSSGNVGIGTTAPSYPAHIVRNAGGQQSVFFSNNDTGSSAATAFIASNGTNEIRLLQAGTSYSAYGAFAAGNGAVYTASDLVLMADGGSSAIKFASGGNGEKMRIDSSGNVGIGTSSVSGCKLDVAGGIKATDLIARNSGGMSIQTDEGTKRIIVEDGGNVVINEGSANADFRVESNSNDHALFVNGGANRINMFSSAAPAEDCQLFVNDVVLIGGTNDVTGGFPTSGLGVITTQGSYCAVFYDDNNLSTPRFRFDRNGNLVVSGSVSKGSGSFRIDHPLSSKSATHDLVHSFIEGPQADLIYRGKVDLVAGSATVNIDTASGMTDGTFVLLCGDVQCFTSNEDGFTAVKGSVSGNTLTITAEDNTCTNTISWMVVGERKDQHMIDTDWTDDNGKVIVEPLKEAAE